MYKIEKFLRDEGGEALWQCFVFNFHHHPGEVQMHYDVEEPIDPFLQEYGDSYEAINQAFEWNETMEGDDFWHTKHIRFNEFNLNKKPRDV